MTVLGTSGSRHIADPAEDVWIVRAACRWVTLPDGWYALSLLSDGRITAEPDDAGTRRVVHDPKRGRPTVEDANRDRSVGEGAGLEESIPEGRPMHQQAGVDRPVAEKAP